MYGPINVSSDHNLLYIFSVFGLVKGILIEKYIKGAKQLRDQKQHDFKNCPNKYNTHNRIRSVIS